MMMTPNPPRPAVEPVVKRQKQDPVLTALWEIKAEMNAQAGYDVQRLLENAHQEVLAMRSSGLLAK